VTLLCINATTHNNYSVITENGTSIYSIVLHRSRVRLGGNNLNLNDTTTQQKAADQIIRPDMNWKSNPLRTFEPLPSPLRICKVFWPDKNIYLKQFALEPPECWRRIDKSFFYCISQRLRVFAVKCGFISSCPIPSSRNAAILGRCSIRSVGRSYGSLRWRALRQYRSLSAGVVASNSEKMRLRK